MNSTESQPVETNPKHFILPFELAFIRWSVACKRWDELSAGNTPLLVAFLAGWCCRCIGSEMPTMIGQFRDSFRCGWHEAEDCITVAKRFIETHPDCKECGNLPETP